MGDKYDTLKEEFNVIQKLWMAKWMHIWATRKMTIPVIIPATAETATQLKLS